MYNGIIKYTVTAAKQNYHYHQNPSQEQTMTSGVARLILLRKSGELALNETSEDGKMSRTDLKSTILDRQFFSFARCDSSVHLQCGFSCSLI